VDHRHAPARTWTPAAIAGIANDPATIAFINALLPQLDAAALAGIVNGNGAWVADLVSGITPATINTMIADLTPWITGTLLPEPEHRRHRRHRQRPRDHRLHQRPAAAAGRRGASRASSTATAAGWRTSSPASPRRR
jgi:hypothetical protein